VAPRPTPLPDPADLTGKIGLPVGAADQLTFYFTLPVDDATLMSAAEDMSTPGTGSYRQFFTNYQDAARTYGANPDDIDAAVKSVQAKGLTAAVDPSRTFVRVIGTAQQWQQALGAPLTVAKATADVPFDSYDFQTPPKFTDLTYVGSATVYVPAVDQGNHLSGASLQNAAAINARPDINARRTATPADQVAAFPVNVGTPPANTCLAGKPEEQSMYTPSQIATAYDAQALVETPETKAVRVSVISLGGGYSPADVAGAAKCFGYQPPTIQVQHGDGITGQIRNNDDETELDLQTMAAYVPGGTIQLIEATNGAASLLDATARMLGDPNGFPDGGSISYAQCALDEAKNNVALIEAITRVLLLGMTVGSSVFAAAGDWGSTMCGKNIVGPSQAFTASSPWVTAIGGTRLTLDANNHRADEVVWNDTIYGLKSGTGGGISRVFKRPYYQNDVTTNPMRVVPDFSALADVTPGWPVMINGQMQSIGGTSGSAPFAMAKEALLSARERLAGRGRIGFPNPWLYQLYKQHPEAFYDITSGTNDLAGVGCCTARKGFDEVSGLGVINVGEEANWLPPPSSRSSSFS
jgi:kumamolisin